MGYLAWGYPCRDSNASVSSVKQRSYGRSARTRQSVRRGIGFAPLFELTVADTFKSGNALCVGQRRTLCAMLAAGRSTFIDTQQRRTTAMTRLVLPIAVLTAMLASSLPAQAQLTRTFVSAAGNDSNPCTITQPCQSFAHAYSLTVANGIIAALDPGKYGPLTITGPVTINGNGWAAITAPAGGNGITVNAVSGNVVLTGLEIDGAGAAYNGVVFNSGSSLTVTNCSLQNLVQNGGFINTGNGILMQPSSGTLNFTITNTTASNNGYIGVNYQPTGGSPSANIVIDHVIATANPGIGINVYLTFASGGTTVVTVANSNVSGNGAGLFVGNSGAPSAAAKMSIDNVSASGNSTGVTATATANVLLGRSVITGNNSGIFNGTSPNTFYTYKDNRINLNTVADVQTSGGSSALNTSFPQQ
jgi:hypothetical protein